MRNECDELLSRRQRQHLTWWGLKLDFFPFGECARVKTNTLGVINIKFTDSSAMHTASLARASENTSREKYKFYCNFQRLWRELSERRKKELNKFSRRKSDFIFSVLGKVRFAVPLTFFQLSWKISASLESRENINAYLAGLLCISSKCCLFLINVCAPTLAPVV